MALERFICLEHPKLVISCLWSTRRCFGLLVHLSNSMRYVYTYVLCNVCLIDWNLYRKLNRAWLNSWSPNYRLVKAKFKMVTLSASRSTYRRKSESPSQVVCDYWLTSNRIHDLESQGLYSNPVQFYDFLQNRVMIIFKPKFEEPDADNEFSLVLSKKQNYDIVCDVFPLQLQLFLTQAIFAIDVGEGCRIPSSWPYQTSLYHHQSYIWTTKNGSQTLS